MVLLPEEGDAEEGPIFLPVRQFSRSLARSLARPPALPSFCPIISPENAFVSTLQLVESSFNLAGDGRLPAAR